jgi:hypothetical protein
MGKISWEDYLKHEEETDKAIRENLFSESDTKQDQLKKVARYLSGISNNLWYIAHYIEKDMEKI